MIVLRIGACLASTTSTDQLRSQLDQLRKETVNTSTKANNVRLRLLRLSEAAEKLRQQAAKSIQVGKENDARDLLLQKKKVLQAMEKSKGRIKLLDDLASKLNEAISIKETHLIGKVSSDVELDNEDDTSPVRIVSSRKEVVEDINDEEKEEEGDGITIAQDQSESEMDRADADPMNGHSALNSIEGLNEIEMPSAFRRISSYNNFLEYLDEDFGQIEGELTDFLRLITLALDDNEKQNNSKVKQIVEVLDKVHEIRRSVHRFKEKKHGN